MEDAIKLFEDTFKDGEEVVIYLANDKFDYGILIIKENGILLKKSLKKFTEYKWHEIVFMAHDGFPVKKIMTYGRFDIFEYDNGPTVNKVRAFLSDETKELEKKKDRPYVTFGDPIEIHNVTTRLINPGIGWDRYGYLYNNTKYEEMMAMESVDGAKGVLFDVSCILEYSPND